MAEEERIDIRSAVVCDREHREAASSCFTDGCWECHGRAAQGGVGPRLGPHPIPLNTIITYVRQPAGEMPPYTAKVISDAELADIYAFLQSIPDPPKVDSIPLLK